MTVRFFYPSAIKALASCTTIRICLCKSFKELFSSVLPGALLLESGCKGTYFFDTRKIFQGKI